MVDSAALVVVLALPCEMARVAEADSSKPTPTPKMVASNAVEMPAEEDESKVVSCESEASEAMVRETSNEDPPPKKVSDPTPLSADKAYCAESDPRAADPSAAAAPAVLAGSNCETDTSVPVAAAMCAASSSTAATAPCTPDGGA